MICISGSGRTNGAVAEAVGISGSGRTPGSLRFTRWFSLRGNDRDRKTECQNYHCGHKWHRGWHALLRRNTPVTSESARRLYDPEIPTASAPATLDAARGARRHRCAKRASMGREEGPRRSGDRRGRRADPRVTGVDLSQKNVPATLTVLTRSLPRRGHFCGPGHSREARATGAASDGVPARSPERRGPPSRPPC